MGTELGATSTIFPSDREVLNFLLAQGREDDWVELSAEPQAEYDRYEKIVLDELEPLIAMPSSPGNVKPVSEVAGQPIYQSYLGSSANPGYRDFAVAAEIVKGNTIQDRVSFDVNPASRQILQTLIRDEHLLHLVQAGSRIHQTGCNGCIGMGQAPATGKLSLRTVPRNFSGRSGTRKDKVCLTSPETVAASALTGLITDPRTLGISYPRITEPKDPLRNTNLLVPPVPKEEALKVQLEKGPNIVALPRLVPLEDRLELPLLLKVGDDISTDEIMPAGSRVLPFRSNIPKISEFVYEGVDPDYFRRARPAGSHAIVGGRNYGQGSSREHAALAPRSLGLRVVIAKSFARIHHQNLLNFGILPLVFSDPSGYEDLQVQDRLMIDNLWECLGEGEIVIQNKTREFTFRARHLLSDHGIDVLRAGGILEWVKRQG
jgi:aconitate hydratase